MVQQSIIYLTATQELASVVNLTKLILLVWPTENLYIAILKSIKRIYTVGKLVMWGGCSAELWVINVYKKHYIKARCSTSNVRYCI